MSASRTLAETLCSERRNHISGGIYHRMQVDFAYNSNHIEGSRLTHDQTRYIFETHTVGIEPANVNDVFEAANHFRCFDRILDTLGKPITEDDCKTLHSMLKAGVLHDDDDSIVIGDYKRFPNEVGSIETVLPEDVPARMQALLESVADRTPDLYDILDFHAKFEQIHPFYDGNGRIGRLLMLRQCLTAGIVPFIVDDRNKMLYYRGLREWQTGGQKGYLLDTALFLQDDMKELLDRFRIDYDHRDVRARDILREHGIG